MFLIQNARCCTEEGKMQPIHVLFSSDGILASGPDLSDVQAKMSDPLNLHVIEARGRFLSPGFVDTHVHLREPGQEAKEDIQSGTAAAAHGGYTTVLAMPNVKPVPDRRSRIEAMKALAEEKACIQVKFYASITLDELGRELVHFEDLRQAGAIAFSDDGRGVQDAEKTKKAMEEIRKIGGLMAQHCEENSLLRGGYIHDGSYARQHGHRGISHSVEEVMTARDLILAAETGCAYHVCHMSTARCCDLLRLAKEKWGANVSAEVTPHHLLLQENQVQEDGKWKMNPPLREQKDVEALLQALNEGLIEMIATDHAPHTAEEKNQGLEKSPFGITGLETAFPLLYTELCLKNKLPLLRLVQALTTGPAKRFGLPMPTLEVGSPADLVLIDLDKKITVSTEDHLSKGKNTPFEGWELYGCVEELWCQGQHILHEGKLTGKRYLAEEGK